MKKGLKWFSSFILGLISTTGFVLADAGDCPFCSDGMMGWMYPGYGMGFFGWIIGLLVIVALILLIIWLIKQLQKK